VSALVDREDLVGRLFFPSSATSETPPGAADLTLEVPRASLHVRRHAAHLPSAVLLAHGNGETVAAWDAAGPAFAAKGFSLVVWDYRGYGRSTGASTFRRMLQDGARVLGEVRSWAPRHLVVMGRSLGSRVAWALGSQVDAVIIDSGYTDVDAFVGRRGLDPAALHLADRALVDPLPDIRSVRCPVLLLHGDEDRAIAVTEAEAAHAACSSELVVLAGRGHDDLWAHPDYERALSAFLARVRAIA
jgi:hypothetical protein